MGNDKMNYRITIGVFHCKVYGRYFIEYSFKLWRVNLRCLLQFCFM